MEQPSPDGSLVPFSSALPVCASKCGPLFDVQGKCIPPITAAVNKNCFCSDSRLTPLRNSITDVSSVCGPTSCTSEVDLTAVQQWFSGFCKASTINDDSGTLPDSNGSSLEKQSWIAGHSKWVALVVIIITIICLSWIMAWFFRRRYLRKKESHVEVADPVAWGPHQLQSATGGFSNYLAIPEKSIVTPKPSNQDLNTPINPTTVEASKKDEIEPPNKTIS